LEGASREAALVAWPQLQLVRHCGGDGSMVCLAEGLG
jgi:hypothetical protein